jgi:hypothetical protein
MRRLLSGIAKLLSKKMPLHNSTLARCISTARVCFRTMQKLSFG